MTDRTAAITPQKRSAVQVRLSVAPGSVGSLGRRHADSARFLDDPPEWRLPDRIPMPLKLNGDCQAMSAVLTAWITVANCTSVFVWFPPEISIACGLSDSMRKLWRINCSCGHASYKTRRPREAVNS